MSNIIKLAIVLGTAREGRRSERVAEHLVILGKKLPNVEVTYVDVADHLETFRTVRFGKEAEADHAWARIAEESDGFVFVIPEYNHGYPGEWKLLMDTLNNDEFVGKACGIAGVSSGVFGGARMVELAKLHLVHRGFYVIRDVLYFPNIKEQFDENGDILDGEQAERSKRFLEALLEATKKYR